MNINELKDIIDVSIVVQQYHLDGLEDDGEEIKFICPWHVETSPSCFVNKQKKIFHCFGCGSSGSIIDFVMKMDGCSFKQAADKLANLFNVSISSSNGLQKGELETITWLVNQRKRAQASKQGENGELFIAKAVANKKEILKTEFWKTRNFPVKVIDFFELGYSNGRIVVPIRDVDGSLIGWSTRAGEVESEERFLHQKGFPKGGYLYNFNNVGKLLEDGQCDMILLVEGFSDVWRAFSHGFLKCVAIMGSNVTDQQISIILKYTYKVCLAFDNDDSGAGKVGMKQFWQKTKNLIDIDWLQVPKGKDVGSLTKEEFWTLYNERKKVA